MEFVKTKIPEVIILRPKVLGDDRGFFMETYRERSEEHTSELQSLS